MAIEFYKEFGDLGYLANYSNHGFYDDGIYYKTVEHYYQASKFDDSNIRSKIINAPTPKEASNIGRSPNNTRKNNFNLVKLKVMENGIYLKFKVNKDIRSKLIETGFDEIKEMSVKESFWGIGPNLDGENHVGTILMSVRDKLRVELRDEIVNNCLGRKVYVLGHRNPDTDSLVSSYILTKILNSYGVDASFAVRDKNFLEKEIYDDYFDMEPVIIDDVFLNDSNNYFVLVDHNNLDGIDKKKVLGAIDHHRITGEVEDLIEIEYSSTALLLYDLFKDEYNFTDEEKILIYLATMSDTDFFTSKRFKDYDRELVKDLGNFNIDELRSKYLKLNDFSKSTYDNLHFDYKEYNKGVIIRRSIIRSNLEEFKNNIELYRSKMDDEGIDLVIWCVYDEETTYVCFRGELIKFPYFTTSTNLVIDYLIRENKFYSEECYSKKLVIC